MIKIISRKDFRRKLNEKMSKLGIRNKEYASMFKVSRLTIWRWKNGITAPYRYARSTILRTLQRAIKNRK